MDKWEAIKEEAVVHQLTLFRQGARVTAVPDGFGALVVRVARKLVRSPCSGAAESPYIRQRDERGWTRFVPTRPGSRVATAEENDLIRDFRGAFIEN
jgi:hypothetical protein